MKAVQFPTELLLLFATGYLKLLVRLNHAQHRWQGGQVSSARRAGQGEAAEVSWGRTEKEWLANQIVIAGCISVASEKEHLPRVLSPRLLNQEG